jgi:type IV secretory pathway VirB4 component
MVGAWAKSARGATATVNPVAALEQTKRRLFISDQITIWATVTMSSLFPYQTASDRAYENDFEFRMLRRDSVMKFHQLRREFAAGRTPMRGEIKGD